MNNERVLNRIEFYNEIRDVLYNEKPQALAKGLVLIYDVLDFLVDLGLEDAISLAFEEDQEPTEIDGDDSSSSEASSLEDSDTE